VLQTCLLVLLVPLPAQPAFADAAASAAAARERLLGLKAQVLRNEESLGQLLAMVAGGRNEAVAGAVGLGGCRRDVIPCLSR
jgi:hypothetical protein